jgi:hypothetical protein
MVALTFPNAARREYPKLNVVVVSVAEAPGRRSRQGRSREASDFGKLIANEAEKWADVVEFAVRRRNDPRVRFGSKCEELALSICRPVYP